MIVDGIGIDIEQVRSGVEQGADLAGAFMERPIEHMERGIEMTREITEDGLDYIDANKDEWIETLSEGASSLAQAIQDTAPELFEALDQSVDELSSLISQHVDPRMGLAFASQIAQLLGDRGAERLSEIEYQEAIGRAALEIEHHAKLQEALRVGDTGRVDTEIDINGASTGITTEFEARHPDEDLEKKVGEDHLRSAIRAPLDDVHHYQEHMHLHSHFEQQNLSRSRRR